MHAYLQPLDNELVSLNFGNRQCEVNEEDCDDSIISRMSVAKGSSGPMPLACSLSATLHDTLSRTLSTTASFISTMLGRMLCVTPALHFNWIR